MTPDRRTEVIAQAIYNTHWRPPTPVWSAASENVKEFVRKQALEAQRAYERSIRTD